MIKSHTGFTVVIGIDPGLNGGIACWRADQPISAFDMPQTEDDFLELVGGMVVPGHTVAFVEMVSGFVGKPQPGSAMFKFGRNFGFILGVLQTLCVRVDLVKPRRWHKSLSLGTASACETPNVWKNKLKACAQRRYPELNPTLKTTDAILILDYGLKWGNIKCFMAARVEQAAPPKIGGNC